MKKMKKILGSLTVVVLALSLAIPAQAAPAAYSYKIRVFAGNEGKFKDGDLSVKEYTNSTFKAIDVEVNDETAEDGSTYKKYYVKGIKPSGSDVVMTTLSNPTFRDADKDMDYVVVYGVRENIVKYTIEYLDVNGNKLADSEEYEGNVGDKPIVPYLYIEGYIPQAYSLTKTLREDKPNVFTFKYTPVPTGGGGGGGDRTVYDEEVVTTTNTTPVVVPGEGGDAAAGGGAAGGGNAVTVVPGDGDAADAGAGAGAGDAGEEAEPAEPEELIDLDDEEVPLANIPGSDGGVGVGSEPGSFFINMPPAVIVGIVSMAVLVVAAAWYLIFKRKKKGTDGNE